MLNTLNKKVLLYGGATLLNYSGLNIFGGPVNLAGNATINTGSGTSLELTNIVSGVGNLTKTGSGTLQLDGTNNYAGTTTISSGKFILEGQLTGGGALTTSSGTTFAPNGGTTGTATVGGALFPNDLTGIGIFKSGNLTMSSGATATFEIRTNGNDLLQVNGNLTLNNATISGADGFFGGIANFGTLTVNNSTITGNSTFTSAASGIETSGVTTVNNSTNTMNEWRMCVFVCLFVCLFRWRKRD